MSQYLRIWYHRCGGVSSDMPGSGLLLFCRYILSLIAFCNLSLDKVKVKVALTSHEGSDRGWKVWHSPLLLYSAQLWRQNCQMYARAALYPQGNSLGIFSIRGWMYPRYTEFEQNCLTKKFSKYFKVPPHRKPSWIVMWCFVLQRHENKHLRPEI